jgi:hypothetical protein
VPGDNYLIYFEFAGLISYTFVLLLQYCPVPDHGLPYANDAAAVLAVAAAPANYPPKHSNPRRGGAAKRPYLLTSPSGLIC